MPTSFHWRCEEKNKTTTLSAVCLMLRPLRAGGASPINLSPSQGRRGGRAGGVRGDMARERQKTRRGEQNGGGGHLEPFLCCLMKLEVQQAVNDSNYNPYCTPPAPSPTFNSFLHLMHMCAAPKAKF